MRLRVLTPAEALVDEAVSSVLGEGTHGWFGLLPDHIDYVAALERSVLQYEAEDGEAYVAVDGGILVKEGDDVVVSTPNAVPAERLEDLEDAVRALFRRESERERDARAVLHRLETDVVQRLIELEEPRA